MVFGTSLPMHILLSSTLKRLSSLSSDKLVESELLMPVQTSNDSKLFLLHPSPCSTSRWECCVSRFSSWSGHSFVDVSEDINSLLSLCFCWCPRPSTLVSLFNGSTVNFTKASFGLRRPSLVKMSINYSQNQLILQTCMSLNGSLNSTSLGTRLTSLTLLRYIVDQRPCFPKLYTI